ncbi:MAG: hypothetical protein HYY87_01230 [Candidatus Levybacteria bacterium]|nr:hypothetical protein [Candidatus Levybacteria bacterium]
MERLLLLLLLFLAVVLGVLTTLPLAFILLVVFYALKRETWLFIAAFFAGVVLDVILVLCLILCKHVLSFGIWTVFDF